MRRRLLLLICLALAVAVPASTANSAVIAGPAPAREAKTCPPGYVRASLTWGVKCLKAGQYCRIKGDQEYHRYGFHAIQAA
jgi:hypothetical protein